jgi:hypothetical protein
VLVEPAARPGRAARRVVLVQTGSERVMLSV